MGDLKNSRIIWAKGILFLLLGIVSAAMLLLRTGDLQVALFLLITIWAFCRAYYFAFYVLEHYVDPTFRFAGRTSFVRYIFSPGKRS